MFVRPHSHAPHPPRRFKGVSLPPSGWVLALLIVVYIFPGLIGHDLWKHDDAVTLGIAYDMASQGSWLLPHLAGMPYAHAPLYYWTAASTGTLFSWLIPFHDAARLASGIYTLFALEFILLAARELHGKQYAAAAPLLLAGSIGFLYHAHEAQPMLAALTAHTAAYWALTLLPRTPRLAVPVLGAAMGLSFLAGGLLPAFALLPPLAYCTWRSANRRRVAAQLLAAFALALLIAAAWLVPLWLRAPQSLIAFFESEWASIGSLQPADNLPRHLNLLLWYAWPALPLSAWALWSQRRVLTSRPLALPIVSFLGVLIILGLFVALRSATALLLLPPLVLLAASGIGSLRRGAANAFDWFGMMTFTVFAAFAWIGWSAMVFGWPERLAQQAVRLEPGFTGHFAPLSVLIAVAGTLAWFWLILTSPRSPMRCIMHWMSGLALFWLLIAMLWMPWINYGKTYRPLSAELAAALSKKKGCIANGNLPDALLASFDYFNGLRTLPLESPEGRQCPHLVLLGEDLAPAIIAAAGWRQTWEGHRPSDRRQSEKIRLYQRDPRRKNAPDLSDLIAASEEEAAQ